MQHMHPTHRSGRKPSALRRIMPHSILPFNLYATLIVRPRFAPIDAQFAWSFLQFDLSWYFSHLNLFLDYLSNGDYFGIVTLATLILSFYFVVVLLAGAYLKVGESGGWGFAYGDEISTINWPEYLVFIASPSRSRSIPRQLYTRTADLMRLHSLWNRRRSNHNNLLHIRHRQWPPPLIIPCHSLNCNILPSTQIVRFVQ